MSTPAQHTSTTALHILEPSADVRVCVMDNKTIRVLGDVSALSSYDARQLAYALMKAGHKI